MKPFLFACFLMHISNSTSAYPRLLSRCCLTPSLVQWNKLPSQLEGTQCNLHIALRPYQLFKLWGKVPLRGSAKKWCLALWSQSTSLIWVAANETSGPAPELNSVTDNCVCSCAQNLAQGQHFAHHCTNQQYDTDLLALNQYDSAAFRGVTIVSASFPYM